MTTKWEDSKKKLTMSKEDIEDEDIEETTKRPPPARNKHMNVVFTRSGKTYDLLGNPNDKTTIIHDDSDDEAGKAKKEEESSSSKPKKSDQSPLKEYKPKIPYP
ncbi:hypothetical protein Tco_1467089 [Tanacetum coccineum]